MAKNISISFIGAGNVAWHLAPAFDNAGYVVREVYSRNADHAKALVKRLYQARPKKHLDFSDSPSQVFVIAVTDTAIEEVAKEIILPEGAVLVHTSGSQPLSTLGYAAVENIGVFYPLQTFTKGRNVDFQEIPILLESNDKSTANLLHQLAKNISKQVSMVSSDDRKVLHVAAVFACNFTNHMFYIAQDIMHANGMDFELLKPLIVETMGKSLRIGPEKSQTGPAMRQDMEILNKHMAYLADHEGLAAIYQAITQNILDTYHND